MNLKKKLKRQIFSSFLTAKNNIILFFWVFYTHSFSNIFHKKIGWKNEDIFWKNERLKYFHPRLWEFEHTKKKKKKFFFFQFLFILFILPFYFFIHFTPRRIALWNVSLYTLYKISHVPSCPTGDRLYTYKRSYKHTLWSGTIRVCLRCNKHWNTTLTFVYSLNLATLQVHVNFKTYSWVKKKIFSTKTRLLFDPLLFLALSATKLASKKEKIFRNNN